ncbi:helix-turn-helix transcriptional regulator [Acidiphilium acidophilum]|uniref:helix-turn-helix domain-containing protein n=1 Tax=Acidiphilium acidophilum TaxID=76588 RepID=UPI002E8E78AE|nr:helix-turn-helix transcriptional regulator [Acidiphilium acidophilum]
MTQNKQTIPQSVGQRIRALRVEKILTQDQLATKLGVSRSAIAQWETDRTGQIRENLKRIARALDTTLTYLISGGTGSIRGDELLLTELYRACAPEDRRLLLTTAKRLVTRLESSPRKL